MMNKRHNIDELFKNSLSGYSAPAPDDAWERLEHELNKSRAPKAAFGWIKIAASILLIGGTIAIGINYFVNKSTASQTEIAEAAKVNSQKVESPNQNSESNQQIEQKNLTVSPASEIDEINAPTQFAARNELKENDNISTSPGSVGTESITNQTENVQLAKNSFEPEPTQNITMEVAIDADASEEATQLAEADPKDPVLNLPAGETLSVPEEKQALPTVNSNELIMQSNIIALNNEEGEEKVNWSVGGQAGPQYTYRESYPGSAFPVEDFDDYESGVLAYAGGIDVEMHTAGRFSFQSGVYYSKIGQDKSKILVDDRYPGIATSWSTSYQVPSRSSNTPSDLVNSTGDISFDKNYSTGQESYFTDEVSRENAIVPGQQFFEFIEIPFIVQYKLLDNKLGINLSGGLWANFLIGNTTYATDNLNISASGKTNNVNTINYSGSLGLGFDYPITSNLALSLEPFFKYYLTQYNKKTENTAAYVYPYSMGLMTGVRYSF